MPGCWLVVFPLRNTPTDEVYNQMSHLLSIPNVFVSAIFRLITNCTREITPLESTNCTRNALSYIIPWRSGSAWKRSPKTWRILGFADATWYLRLQVFTTDQPRCYSFDKVLYPPGFCKKIYGFLVFGTKSSRKIFSFSLVDVGTCKNSEKMFLLTGKN